MATTSSNVKRIYHGRAAESSRKSRRRALRVEALERLVLLSTVVWDGEAGDGKWSTASNWSGNVLPGAGDDVVLDGTSPAGAVTVDAGARSVRSLNSTKDFAIAGGASLTVTGGNSALGGGFTIAAGATLSATGASTRLQASGAATIDGASLYASSGATISLPTAVRYTNTSQAPMIRATGAGSAIDLSGVARLTQGEATYRRVDVEALSGGVVDLRSLALVVDPTTGDTYGRSVNVRADGTDSAVDLSSLATFQDVNAGGRDGWAGLSTLQASNGGVLRTPALATLGAVGLYHGAGGSIDASRVATIGGGQVVVYGGAVSYPALTSLAGGSIAISGGTLALPALADVDGTSLYASGGARLALPAVTRYANTSQAPMIRATGAGSVVDLSGVARLTQGEGTYRRVDVEALSGGVVDLRSLALVVDPTTGDTYGRSVNVRADGTDSAVDLSALATFQDVNAGGRDGWAGLSTLQASNGGVLRTPALATLGAVGLYHGAGGSIDASRVATIGGGQVVVYGGAVSYPALTSLAGGSIAISGGTLALPALADVDGTSLYASGGARLALPSVTRYANTSQAPVIRATGAGSVVDLSGVARLTQGEGTYRRVDVEALSGGVVDLRSLALVVDPTTGDTYGRSVNVRADGTDSAVDLSALATFQDVNPGGRDGWAGLSTLQASNGGTLLVGAAGGRVELQSMTVARSGGGKVLFTGGGAAAEQGAGELVFTRSTSLSGEAFSTAGTLSVASGVALDVNTSLEFRGAGRLVLPAGASLSVSGDLLGASTSPDFVLAGAVTLDGAGTPALPQVVEVMGADLGKSAAGYRDNLAFNNLALANGTYVKLVDRSRNRGGAAPEALYVNSLVVPTGTALDLGGLHLYAQGAVIQGQVTQGEVAQSVESGPIAQNAPTVGRIGLVGEADEWTFYGRAGRWMTIAVNPSNAVSPAPPTPYLGVVKVTLYDANGAVLATGASAAEGQAVTLANVVLASDGLYKVRVEAGTTRATATGNYLASVWDATPDVATLPWNRQVAGDVESPYSVDRWTFAAQKDQQVRFDLIDRSSTSIVFTLAGPNGWTGFVDLGADSDLITLPSSGAYTLTARGTGGVAGGYYAFQLDETSRVDLALGSTYTGSLSGDGQARLFRVQVPAGTPMLIRLDDASSANHNEVYARLGSPPTRSDYDHRFTSPSSADQTLTVPRAAPGVWYVLVYGDDVQAASTYTLTVASSSVLLDHSTPDRHGNSADAVLTIAGAGFAPGTKVELVRAGATIAASSVQVDSLTRITATFAAGRAPAGVYDVRVTHPDGTSAVLPGAFASVAGGKAELETNLVLPAAMGWHETAQIIVRYQNVGDVAMPSPLLTLDATVNGKQGGFFTLDASLVAQGFWTSSTPEGFGHSVQFLATGAVPGVLQPGESGSVTVYYAGWQQPWAFGSNFDFQLYVTDVNNATPIDWSSIKEGMRPATISAAAWEPIFANLAANTGPTWGDYVRMLDENAAYLGRLGRTVYDIGELLSFEVQQAIGLGPVRTIGAVTDDSVDAVGMDLTFGRTFDATLVRRNTLGVLGRGWVWMEGWDRRSSVRADGTVVITSPGGDQRVFQPDSRKPGAYFSEPGDHARISGVNGRALVLQEQDGTRYTFDASGRIVAFSDANGNTIAASYTGDNLTRLTHSSGAFMTLEYNAAGRIKALRDSAGRETTYTYDASHEHLISVKAYDGRVTTYTYATGQGAAREHALTQITSPSGVKVDFRYDAQGRLASTFMDGDVEVTTFSYDAAGTVSITTPASAGSPGGTVRYFYDERGAVARLQDALGYSTTYTRDALGRLLRVTDAGGRSTVYSYNAAGLVASQTDALGGTTTFAYNGPFDRMTGFVDALGRSTGYEYDAKGNLKAITYADAKQEKWTYDAFGNVATSTNRRGQAVGYGYDSAGRLTSKTYPDKSVVTYEYDARGNMFRTTDANGVTTYEYEAGTDRLLKITYPGAHTLQFTYCACGRRDTMTDETGYVLTYHYDDHGRLTSLTDSEGVTQVAYTYDAQGYLIRKELPNGVYTTYAYDAAGQTLSLVNHNRDGSVLSSFEYAYDERGLRKSMDTVDGEWIYEYDDLGQFVGWTDPAGSRTSYVYDAMGNRLSETVGGVTTVYTVNALNQYTKVGDVVYTYDDDGNLTRRAAGADVTTYTYDVENRLLTTANGANTWSNVYDAMGNLAKSSKNGTVTTYVIDPAGYGNVVRETVGGASTRLVYGLGLLSTRAGAATSYYTFDALGSVADVTNAAGASLGSYAYDPFGGVVSASAPAEGRFGFVGEHGIRVEAGGRYTMRARVYDADLGRFLSQDPVGVNGGSTNLYQYALNNPATYTDPTGETVNAPPRATPTPLPTLMPPCRNGYTRIKNGDCLPPNSQWDTTGPQKPPRGQDSGISNFGDTSGKGRDGGGRSVPGQGAPKENPGRGVPPKRGPGEDPGGPGSPPASTPPPIPGTPTAPPTPTPPVESRDPNQKLGPSGYGAGQHIAAGSLFAYRVDFENDATATAPARLVDIVDPLSTNLDWGTLQFTSFGWGDVLFAIPAGLSYYRAVVPMTYNGKTFNVEVELGLRADTGELYAQFYSIDPTTGLPPDVLTGFLPPEDSTGRGQGFFTYTIEPKAGLPTGTVIRNIARITFDRGETIATDQVDPHDPSKGVDPDKQAWNTIDAGTPTSAVTALGATQAQVRFTVRWAGLDDVGGSGVASYDVYVSVDGGSYSRWLDATTATSAAYQGLPGRTYRFYSVARDHVGHVESAPATPDAITVVAASAAEPRAIDPAGQVVAAGGTATFAAATAMYGATVRWQSSPDGDAWSDVAGADRAWYTLTPALADSGRRFRAVFTAPDGAVEITRAATLTVVKPAVAMTVTTSAAPRRIGDPFSITVVLAAADPAVVPGGMITVVVGPHTLRGASVDGRAVFQVPELALGAYSAVVSYEGDGTFAPSQASTSVVVVRGGSSLAPTVPSEGVVGRAVTLSARLDVSGIGAGVDPTGGVMILDGGQPIGFAQLSTTGGATSASFTTSTLAAGRHYIQMSYLGDPRTFAASSGVYVLTIGASASGAAAVAMAGTTSAAAASASSSPSAGGPVAIALSSAGPVGVRATAGVPVTLTASTSLADASAQWQSSADGTTWADLAGANLTWYRFTPTSADSGRMFRAVFTSGGQVETTSAAVLPVVKAGVTLSVSSSAAPRRIGDALEVTVRAASTSAGAPTPVGTVTLRIGAQTLVGTLVDGVVVFRVAELPLGTYEATASYAGDATFAAAESGLSQVVVRGATTLGLAVPATAVAGQPATLTVWLTYAGVGTAPAGGVVFLDGGQPIGFVQVSTSNGSTWASFTTSSLAVGDHYFQMVYLGDPRTFAASSGVAKLTVAAAPAVSSIAAASADDFARSSLDVAVTSSTAGSSIAPAAPAMVAEAARPTAAVKALPRGPAAAIRSMAGASLDRRANPRSARIAATSTWKRRMAAARSAEEGSTLA